MRNGDWIQTFTGLRFYPLDPRPEEINIIDIAHALSNQGRFAGHSRLFISVAQHSEIVSLACDPEDALWGLLHDAGEAYLVDLPRPVKQMMGDYREAEHRLMTVICERFGLSPVMSESVRKADEDVLAAEVRDHMKPIDPEWRAKLDLNAWPHDIPSLSPKVAERRFLKRYEALT